MKGDGNCFYYAVSYLLYGTPDKHQIIKDKAIDYLIEHLDDYKGFITQDIMDYPTDEEKRMILEDQVNTLS